MQHLHSFFTSLFLFFVSFIVFMLYGCSASIEEKEPDAQIPLITAVSADVSTVLNIPMEIFIKAETRDGGALEFQWFCSESKLDAGKAIPDANSATLVPATTQKGIFYYYCVVINRLGKSTHSATSPRITYTVNDSIHASTPTILNQSGNITAYTGEPFVLSVAAFSQDGGTLSYQWYFEAGTSTANSEEIYSAAQKIEGANLAAYSATARDSSAGWYFCVITNSIEDNGDGGAKTASTRTTPVIVSTNAVNADSPVIIAQPKSDSVIIPGVHVFTVGAYTADDGILSYQWYFLSDENSTATPIEGATSATYKATADTAGRTGWYCVITNTLEDNGDGGIKTATVTSETAWLEALYLKDVVPPPAFTKQPPALNVVPYDGTITLSCEAESPEHDVVYRWYKSEDGTTSSGQAIDGANSASFTTARTSEKGISYYYCVASVNVQSGSDGSVESVSALSDVVSVACTGLPTLYLNLTVPLASVTRSAYVKGKMTILSAEYADFEYSFEKEKEGIKGRGNSSWGMPKKSYNIKFDKKQKLFNLPKAKKWCITANYADKTLLRNRFASILGNSVLFRMDEENNVTSWNPHLVSLDVVINDEYQGNYTLCEKITLSDGRVAVQDITEVKENLESFSDDKILDANADGIKDLHDGGFILEIEGSIGRASENEFYFQSSKGRYFCLKDPDSVSEEIFEHIKNVVQTAEDVLYGDDFKDAENGWQKYLDVDSFVDWFIVNELTKNNDAVFFSSVYMYYNPTDQKLHMGPNWDFDISCGNINYNGCDNYEGWWIKNSVWIKRLFEDEAFVNKVKERWNAKAQDIHNLIESNAEFSSSGIQALADGISISAEYNFEKWNILGRYVWPNAAGYQSRTTYQSEIDYMIDWLNHRIAWFSTAVNTL